MPKKQTSARKKSAKSKAASSSSSGSGNRSKRGSRAKPSSSSSAKAKASPKADAAVATDPDMAEIVASVAIPRPSEADTMEMDAAAPGRKKYPGGDAKLAHKAKTAKIGVDTELVNKIFLRVREIKSTYPKLASEVDWNEWEIRKRLENIRASIDQLPVDSRELVAVLVINGIHRMCDEILIDAEVNEIAGEPREGK